MYLGYSRSSSDTNDDSSVSKIKDSSDTKLYGHIGMFMYHTRAGYSAAADQASQAVKAFNSHDRAKKLSGGTMPPCPLNNGDYCHGWSQGWRDAVVKKLR
jgi:hypothetical protein